MTHRFPREVWGLLFLTSLTLLSACRSLPHDTTAVDDPEMRAHYVEIVSTSVGEQRTVLEQAHGLSFGPPVADLGQAQVAETASGTLIGVRAPLSEREQPIVRVYFAVDDITAAVEAAESAGAVLAYPPTVQGETGTWAIYFLDGIQVGLWQR